MTDKSEIVEINGVGVDINIIVSHYNECLNWTKDLSAPFHIVSKTITSYDNNHVIHQPDNLGREASAYLGYICKMYDTLPEWCIFVHGHEYSWHHTGRLQDVINNVISGVGVSKNHTKYKNINSYPPNYYIEHSEDGGHYNHDPDAKRGMVYGLKTVRDCIELGMFKAAGIHDMITTDYIAKPAAQFIVHRDLIKRYDVSVYQRLLEDLYKTPYDDKMKACVYEAMWMRLFTGYWNELEWIKDTES